MSDPRSTPANGRVAHTSLRGKVEADSFVDGNWAMVTAPLAPVLNAPGGARGRELLLGAEFCVLEDRGGFSFGFARRDGYVGYIASEVLRIPAIRPTHEVDAIRSYAKEVPDLKDTGVALPISFGAGVSVIATSGAWSKFSSQGRELCIPSAHLRPRGLVHSDPASVAEMFLGTPYLWGGNSAFGIDCSGLVQAALEACAIPCLAGDSDQQEALLGMDIAADKPLRRNDLLFWKGHVAMCVDADTMIHANANDMAVAYEAIAPAIARIEAAGDGPVTARKRLAV